MTITAKPLRSGRYTTLAIAGAAAIALAVAAVAARPVFFGTGTPSVTAAVAIRPALTVHARGRGIVDSDPSVTFEDNQPAIAANGSASRHPDHGTVDSDPSVSYSTEVRPTPLYPASRDGQRGPVE
jgi:hypothetical protein